MIRATLLRLLIIALVAVGAAFAFPAARDYVAMDSCLDAGRQWAYGSCHEATETEFINYGNPNQTWIEAHTGAITTALIAGVLVAGFFAVRDYLSARRTRVARLDECDSSFVKCDEL